MFKMSRVYPEPSQMVFDALNQEWTRYECLWAKARAKTKPGTVHDLRTTIRRLNAALELAEALARSLPRARCRCRKLKKELKGELHALRKLRDFQVEEDTIARAERLVPELSPLRAYLSRHRRQAAKQVKRRLGRTTLKVRRKDVDRINRFLIQIGKKSGRTALLQLARRYRRLRSSAERARLDRLETVHQVRIDFKKFRYDREVLAPLLSWPVSVESQAKYFQRILGEIQDAVVLIAEIERYLGGGKARFNREIEEYLRRLRKERAVRLREFARVWRSSLGAFRGCQKTWGKRLALPVAGSRMHPRRVRPCF